MIEGGAPLIPPPLRASLVLVRHGESTWIVEGRFQGRGDPPLSPRGERQAELVADRLADPYHPSPLPIPLAPPFAIRHSPLARARQTATAIATVRPAELTPPLTVDEDLTELAQGAWEGLPAERVADEYAAALASWRRDPVRFHAPGGEPLPEADRRVRRALGRLLAEMAHGLPPLDPAATIPQSKVLGYGQAQLDQPWSIVVAHDGIFRLALLALLDLPLEHFWRFPFQLCGISIVELRDGHGTLRAHNLADHLAPLALATEAEEAARRQRGAF